MLSGTHVKKHEIKARPYHRDVRFDTWFAPEANCKEEKRRTVTVGRCIVINRNCGGGARVVWKNKELRKIENGKTVSENKNLGLLSVENREKSQLSELARDNTAS